MKIRNLLLGVFLVFLGLNGEAKSKSVAFENNEFLVLDRSDVCAAASLVTGQVFSLGEKTICKSKSISPGSIVKIEKNENTNSPKEKYIIELAAGPCDPSVSKCLHRPRPEETLQNESTTVTQDTTLKKRDTASADKNSTLPPIDKAPAFLTCPKNSKSTECKQVREKLLKQASLGSPGDGLLGPKGLIGGGGGAGDGFAPADVQKILKAKKMEF